MGRAAWLCGAVLALGATCCVLRPSRSISWDFEILDERGLPSAARVTLLDAHGKGVAPEGLRLFRSVTGVPYFYTDGRFSVSTQLTILRARVWRGPEYEPMEQELGREERPTQIRPARAWDMNAKGWYCGDGHIHALYFGHSFCPTNAELMTQARAEALNVANLLAANAFDGEVFLRDRVTGRDEPESDATHILRVCEEYRASGYGHMSVYGIRRLSDPVYTGFKGTSYPFDFPTNHEACLKYQADGAFATFAHLMPCLKMCVFECPVDVALGSLNAIEIQGYAVETVGAIAIWERLMSAGFDVTVSAGTDCFLSAEEQGPMGGARCYVDMAGRPFTYANWVDQLSKGKGFTTNGAMLFLKVDGKTPGDAIDLKPGETRDAQVEVIVDSLFLWDKVAVRMNGADALVFTSASGNPHHQVFAGRIKLTGPSWVYAKLNGPNSPWFGAGGWNSKHPEHEAVTNSVWVRRGQEPRRDAASLDYFIRWVQDNLETLELRKNYGSPENRAKVRDTFQRALKVFQDRRAECHS